MEKRIPNPLAGCSSHPRGTRTRRDRHAHPDPQLFMTPQQTIETEETRTQSFAEWIQANTRAVGIGAAVVLVAAAGYWFYLRSAEIKRANAERGLNQAKQSLAAGNAGLAQS